jgi:hypothetical protein
VEHAERAHELLEVDDPVALEVEEVEHPVGEEVRALAGSEEGELELLLMKVRDYNRDGDAIVADRRWNGRDVYVLLVLPCG